MVTPSALMPEFGLKSRQDLRLVAPIAVPLELDPPFGDRPGLMQPADMVHALPLSQDLSDIDSFTVSHPRQNVQEPG